MTPLLAADDAPRVDPACIIHFIHTDLYSAILRLPVRHLPLVPGATTRATANNSDRSSVKIPRPGATALCWQARFRRLSKLHRTATWPRHSKVIVDHVSSWTLIASSHSSLLAYTRFYNQYFVFTSVIGATLNHGGPTRIVCRRANFDLSYCILAISHRLAS